MPRVTLPPDLAEKGERLLAWAAVEGDGGRIMASTKALYLPATGHLTAATRLPWTAVDRATWTEPELNVHARVGDSERHWRIRLAEAGRMPEVVRERVTASIVISEHVELTEGAGARIVGRRGGSDDPIEWSITFDAGLDPTDPVLRGAAVSALADLRESLGI
jgi:hypothetical protein